MSVVIPKEKTRKAKLPNKESEVDQSTKQSQSTKPSKKRSAEQSNDQSESPAKKSKQNTKSSDDQSVKQESVKQENQSDNVSATPSNDQTQTESEAKKKRKRRRSLAAVAPTSLDTAELETAAPAAKQSKQSNQSAKEEKKRYIVFVGNLPYRCSKESLAKFFDVADASVRIPTNKENNKPKGFAFVEFTDPFGLQRALKLHHTEFQERKINVELTAGGGGKSENRTNKIAARNEKLTKQRKNAADKRAVEKTSNQSNEKSNDHSQAPSNTKQSAEQSTEQSDEPAKKKRKRKPKKKADADAAADSE